MTAGASRSARSIDPISREAAEDLARRSGLTLNEWVALLVAEGPEDATSQDYFAQSPPEPPGVQAARVEAFVQAREEVSRVTEAIERLSDRIQSAESRQALAVVNIERSVREVIARIDAAEREQMQAAARLEGEVRDVREETAKLDNRLSDLETVDQAGEPPASADAVRALENAIGKVAGHVYETDKRQRDRLTELHGRIERLATSEQTTQDAIRELQTSCSVLDERLSLTQRGGQEGIEKAAANLGASVQAAREELGRQLAEAADARFDRVEQALARMSEHVRNAEQRSAGAVERMGREVLEVAQTLNRRVQSVELHGAQITERVGLEVSRIAGAVEDRLARADTIQAQALEKLGNEIARITERLADRIANAERRSAQAIDDVSEQVVRVTERIGQRNERAASELVERIRQSEERTAKLLEEARQKIDERLAETQRRIIDAPPAAQALSAGEADDDLFVDAPFPALEATAETSPEALAEPPQAALPETLSGPFARYALPAASAVESIFAPEAPVEPVTFEAKDFEAVASFDAEIEPEPAIVGSEAESEPVESEANEVWTAESEATATAIEMEAPSVELEPNVGFDLDEDLLAPAPTASRASDEIVADHELETPAGEEAAEATPVSELEPPAPLTTRDVIERARAAARERRAERSARPLGAPSAGDESILRSLSFGRSRQRTRGPSGALMAASLLAVVGLAASSYVFLEGQAGGGKLPKRLADALSVVRDDRTSTPAGSAAPMAALALTPTLNAPASSPQDLAALYSAAVAKTSAGDAAGLAQIRKLADRGYAPAQFYLGEAYQDGKAGLKRDAVESRKWLERAAEGGDRTAMHNLALDYHEGVGGGRDAATAASWFRRAAELGLLDSQFNLAALYEHGDGVGQNPAEAYKWYLIASKAGDAEARAGALRVRTLLLPDERLVAERAAAEFEPAQPNLAAPPPLASATSPDVTTAQRALNQLGYYQGPSDGVISPALRLALSAYQRDQSLPVTGAPDTPTIARLSAYTR
jgi:localization factor PodJL